MADSRSVLIAGGGIAGLTSALLLSRSGFQVNIFERSKRFDELGAGIQISPNALRILDDLDIGKQIRLVSTNPAAIRILGAFRGNKLAEVPLGATAIERFGLPYICVHRADLHRALLGACNNDPDIRIKMDCEIKDCTSHANGISALFLENESIDTASGNFMVFADGIRSKFRNEIFDQSPAYHTGYEAWRTMVPVDKMPINFSVDYTHLVLARGSHAVFYPVRGGRHINVVIITRSKSKLLKTRRNADPELLFSRTRFWSSELRKIITDADEWSVWPLLDTPVSQNWHNQSMVMIGDAAHGMSPYAAQGAAMAIEDAKVLADCLNENEQPQKAFAAFHSKRRSRIKKIRKLANTNRQLYHMGIPFNWVRNLGMALTPSKRLLERQAWIYNWRG